MLGKRLIKSNDAGGGACTNTVDLYNPFPDGGGVALYQLNGDATDVSGNYNGTATNVTYGAGQFGQAGVFNGSSSYINLGDPTAGITTANYSISFWFKTTDTNTPYLISKYFGDGLNTTDVFRFTINSSGKLVARITTPSQSPDQKDITSTTTVSNNVWNNAVLVVSPSIAKLYINNSQEGGDVSGAYIAPSTVTRDVFIGKSQNDIGYLDGSIDQVRIFNRALRPYEVEALYTEEYCTPTIVPSQHFNTVTYTGTGLNQQVTGVGFEPDFVWIKSRSGAFSHVLQDSERGSYAYLSSNGTAAENTNSNRDWFRSFDSDGFTLGPYIATSGEPAPGWNEINQTYVAWCWKAGGAAVTIPSGTNGSNTDSIVSANVEAGFSIVKYNNPANNPQIVSHGLGKTPSVVITKGTNLSSNWNFMCNIIDGSVDGFELNTTNAKFDLPDAISEHTFSTRYPSSFQSIAYCFAEVEGFSSFGSYVGTGAAGNTVVTGFEPAFLMMKKTSGTTNAHWQILDNKRNPSNPVNKELYANLSGAENQLNRNVNFLENGFELTSSAYTNDSGASYIYMAFAADPTAVEPTLEDSFNTVLYTGTGASRSITGVGFQPDFTWIKGRSDAADYHNLFDSVRGADRVLISNLTNAEYNGGGSAYFPSFDSDGFSLSGNAIVNGSGQTYVSWNWKGAEIPAINSNGSIPSVVSANPAAGFSIVSWSGNSSTATIGHGLNSAPKMIISKDRNFTERWNVFHASVGTGKYLSLETSNAAISFANAWPTLPDENVWYMSNWENATGHNYISYVFAEVAGFSKFGSYSGNSSTQSINVGFEPAFVLIKASSIAYNWYIFDNKRGAGYRLFPDVSNAEDFSGNQLTSFDSDGFTLGNSPNTNNSGQTFIYMAFANQF